MSKCLNIVVLKEKVIIMDTIYNIPQNTAVDQMEDRAQYVCVCVCYVCAYWLLDMYIVVDTICNVHQHWSDVIELN